MMVTVKPNISEKYKTDTKCIAQKIYTCMNNKNH